MNQDLAITGHQFGLAVGIFFIGYSLFEIPSNLLLHKIGACGDGAANCSFGLGFSYNAFNFLRERQRLPALGAAGLPDYQPQPEIQPPLRQTIRREEAAHPGPWPPLATAAQ